MTHRLVDAHLLVHLYAPTDGPNARAAYGALRDIWAGCRQMFAMTDPVPALALRSDLPATVSALPAFPAPTVPELPVAAQRRTDGTGQVLLRRHHDVLSLSAVIPVRTRGQEDDAPVEEWPGWHAADRRWDEVTGEALAVLLGETRIHLASVLGYTNTADLARRMRPLLPAGSESPEWWLRGAEVDAGCTVWELTGGDTRDRRRMLVVGDAERDPQVSAWLWSRGDAEIPPLARYLLHAAKLRYEVRVWQHDRDRILAAAGDAAATAGARVAEMRRTVEIAADNIERARGIAGVEAVDRGPFHDDQGLAGWFAAQLDDDAAYLDAAATRRRGRPVERHVSATPDEAFDPRRVFVIHGRDEQARSRMFDFLYSLDLLPLEWESLVTATGTATPDIRAPIARGLALAAAVVAIMTPDDSVQLHPALGMSPDSADEAGAGLQPRPNVFFELGMAYAMYPTRTIITVAGRMRGASDLAALNVVRLDGSISCEDKIVSRLRIAGCPVEDVERAHRGAGHFGELDAWQRLPRLDVG